MSCAELASRLRSSTARRSWSVVWGPAPRAAGTHSTVQTGCSSKGPSPARPHRLPHATAWPPPLKTVHRPPNPQDLPQVALPPTPGTNPPAPGSTGTTNDSCPATAPASSLTVVIDRQRNGPPPQPRTSGLDLSPRPLLPGQEGLVGPAAAQACAFICPNRCPKQGGPIAWPAGQAPHRLSTSESTAAGAGQWVCRAFHSFDGRRAATSQTDLSPLSARLCSVKRNACSSPGSGN